MGIFDKPKKADESKPTDNNDLGALQEALTKIADATQANATAISTMAQQNNASFSALAKALETNIKPTDPEPKAKEISDDDFENMSNKELFSTIVDRVEGVLNDVVGKKFDDISGKVSTVEARNQLDKVRSKYPDFDKWKDEMGQVYNNNNNLTDIEDIYLLAKARNPEKVKQLLEEEETANEEAEGKEKEEETDHPIDFKKLFGGLQSGSASEEGKGEGDSSPKPTKEVIGSIVDRAFEDPGLRGLLNGE